MNRDYIVDYLLTFAAMAQEVGIELKKPGLNWVSTQDLAPGSHLSLSVTRSGIEVNLNNTDDADRRIYNRLWADRAAIAVEVNSELIWQAKPGVKKTAVRAALTADTADQSDWARQHAWAVDTLSRFKSTFGPRLAR